MLVVILVYFCENEELIIIILFNGYFIHMNKIKITT